MRMYHARSSSVARSRRASSRSTTRPHTCGSAPPPTLHRGLTRSGCWADRRLGACKAERNDARTVRALRRQLASLVLEELRRIALEGLAALPALAQVEKHPP